MFPQQAILKLYENRAKPSFFMWIPFRTAPADDRMTLPAFPKVAPQVVEVVKSATIDWTTGTFSVGEICWKPLVFDIFFLPSSTGGWV